MGIWYAVYSDNDDDNDIPLLVTSHYKNTCKLTDSLIDSGNGCTVIETSPNGIRTMLYVKRESI